MMSQSRCMLMLACVVLALSGAAASSRGFARQLTSCTNGCSTILGSAASFGVIGTSTVTSSGLTKVDGDLGVPNGAAVSGFPPGNVTGTIYIGGPVEAQAKVDATNAYDMLAAMPHNTSAELSGRDLKDMHLTPGVYYFASSATLSGNLTLNAEGNMSAVFVLQVSSTFNAATKANILLINGAKACNVFITVGSSSTIYTEAVIRGSVIAQASITLQAKVAVHGAVIALNGAVTMADTNRVNSPSTCNWSGGNRPDRRPSSPPQLGGN